MAASVAVLESPLAEEKPWPAAHEDGSPLGSVTANRGPDWCGVSRQVLPLETAGGKQGLTERSSTEDALEPAGGLPRPAGKSSHEDESLLASIVAARDEGKSPRSAEVSS
mmetsp:Transcript_7235/g.21416  ORF Transcript_7235/g.21416 Transcript_7235/m.21416 type:complete len:110 (-) Transcript_7235:100-429(-)